MDSNNRFPTEENNLLSRLKVYIKNKPELQNYLKIASASIAFALPLGTFFKSWMIQKIEQSYSHYLKLDTIILKLGFDAILPTLIITLMFIMFFFFAFHNAPKRITNYNHMLYIIKLCCLSNIFLIYYITYTLHIVSYFKYICSLEYLIYIISLTVAVILNLLFMCFKYKIDDNSDKKRFLRIPVLFILFILFVVLGIFPYNLFIFFVFKSEIFFIFLILISISLVLIPYSWFYIKIRPKKINIKIDTANLVGILLLIFFIPSILIDFSNKDSIGKTIIMSQNKFVSIDSNINYKSKKNVDGYLLFETIDNRFVAKGYKFTEKKKEIRILSGYKYVDCKNLELSEKGYSIKLDDTN